MRKKFIPQYDWKKRRGRGPHSDEKKYKEDKTFWQHSLLGVKPPGAWGFRREEMEYDEATQGAKRYSIFPRNVRVGRTEFWERTSN
jgi:hypothetical protein